MPWIGPELDEGFDMSTMKVKDIGPAQTESIMDTIVDHVLAECADMLEEMARTAKAHEMSGSEALKLAAEAFREKKRTQ